MKVVLLHKSNQRKVFVLFTSDDVTPQRIEVSRPKQYIFNIIVLTQKEYVGQTCLNCCRERRLLHASLARKRRGGCISASCMRQDASAVVNKFGSQVWEDTQETVATTKISEEYNAVTEDRGIRLFLLLEVWSQNDCLIWWFCIWYVSYGPGTMSIAYTGL